MGEPVDDPVSRVMDALGIAPDAVPEVPRDPKIVDFDPESLTRRKRDHEARRLPDGPVLVPATAITAEPVRWLWHGWLARGKLALLAGQPGQGKTTLGLAAAAAVSSGRAWPDGSRCDQASVLIWSGEDDAADTLLPRLLAMGADPKHIYFVTGTRQAGEVVPFDPARDLVGLAAAAAQVGDVALLMIDPVVSAVGAGDGNANTTVRRALQPLVDLAAVLDCAVLGISHFTKGSAGRDPTERVTGSVAFGAVARIVLVAAKAKKDDGDHRILARAKSNIGPDDGAISYQLVQAEVPGAPGLLAAVVKWGDPLRGTARELLAEAERQDDEEEASALDDAQQFLRTELADGPLTSKALLASAREAGHAERTLKRAKQTLGIQARKTKAGWAWSLPGKDAKETKSAKDANQNSLASLASLQPRTAANNSDGDAEVFR